MATLEEVNRSLRENRDITDEVRYEVSKVGSYLKRYFDGLRNQRGDRLEAERERKRSTSSSVRERISNTADRARSGFPGLLPMAALGAPLAATGLRGFEMPILKGLKKLVNNIVPKLLKALKRIVRAPLNALRRLGKLLLKPKFIDDIIKRAQRALRNIIRSPLKALRAINERIAKGGVGRGMKIADDVIKGAGRLLKNLRKNILKSMGLGPDGKLLSVKGVDGKFTKNIKGMRFQEMFKSLGKVSSFVQDLFSGISRFAGAATKATASLAGGGLKMIGSGAGGILKMFGKILWPIGVLVALYDGVMAYKAEGGDTADKFAAGVAGFIGDIVGAPMNLIKGAVSWILKEMGFEKAAEWLNKNIDFEEIISKSLNKLWDFFRAGIRWFGKLLRDPVGALTDLLKLFLNGAADLGGWIWENGLKPLFSWVLGIFPNPVPKIKELGAAFGKLLTDFGAWVYDTAIKPLGDWFSSMFDFEWPEVDFGKVVTDLKDYITGFASEIISYLKTSISNWWNGDTEGKQSFDKAMPDTSRYIGNAGPQKSLVPPSGADTAAEMAAIEAYLNQGGGAPPVVAPTTTVADNSTKQTINNLNQAGINTYDYDGALGGIQ